MQTTTFGNLVVLQNGQSIPLETKLRVRKIEDLNILTSASAYYINWQEVQKQFAGQILTLKTQTTDGGLTSYRVEENDYLWRLPWLEEILEPLFQMIDNCGSLSVRTRVKVISARQPKG